MKHNIHIHANKLFQCGMFVTQCLMTAYTVTYLFKFFISSKLNSSIWNNSDNIRSIPL